MFYLILPYLLKELSDQIVPNKIKLNNLKLKKKPIFYKIVNIFD